jgi:hypothetical protein
MHIYSKPSVLFSCSDWDQVHGGNVSSSSRTVSRKDQIDPIYWLALEVVYGRYSLDNKLRDKYFLTTNNGEIQKGATLK